jgi:stearoyl-CoA desaturase (delta-9 desaturase)
MDWDPSKWIILTLYRLGLVTGLRRAGELELNEATIYMHHKTRYGVVPGDDANEWKGEVWDIEQVRKYAKGRAGSCVLLINGFVLDATPYLEKHVRPFFDPEYLTGIDCDY